MYALGELRRACAVLVHPLQACAKSLQSCLTLSDSMDVARQAPLSMGFLRQEHWSGLPFAPPGHLPDVSPALAGSFFRTLATRETLSLQVYVC